MLDKKVALITGANTGIGKEIALTLAAEGFIVIVNYLFNEEKAQEVKSEIEGKGGQCHLQYGDVSDFTKAAEIMEEAFTMFGRLDVLVNNAGITRDQLVLRMTEEDFDDVLRVNLKGTFNCVKGVSKRMLKQRFGKIINMSSVVGIMGNIGQCNYSASKAGVIGLTKSLAREFAARNIQVNAIAPGFIETDMTDKIPEKIKEEMISTIPLQRMGKPEDIASLVAFLASDKANYITGQIIQVDGGMAM
ncbi:MAG: beta-ketoacyl-ACP reductase [Firmicutes bacterium HGW-Firmicutes-1]|jgi:3-oxoacyl-[acyl-carrier protein] reductase|nr:MAG: beta-ketoacyl-ACP reductase [Firmicutes bacterium HGW-Firmicutes-1]